MTFVIAAALAAVAGTMYLMYYGVVSFSDGFVPGVKGFTAAVLRGIGSLPGCVIGGLLIGLIETMWSVYFSIDYKDVAAFSVLAITLIFLPQGLFGRPDVEKVSSMPAATERPDVARALKDAGLTALMAFGLFLPLVGFLTVSNIRNELVLETRFPLLITVVAIIAIGRLFFPLVVEPWSARRRALASHRPLALPRSFTRIFTPFAIGFILIYPLLALAGAGFMGPAK